MKGKVGKIILFSIVFGSLTVFIIFSNDFFRALTYMNGVYMGYYGADAPAVRYNFGFYISVSMLVLFVISFMIFWIVVLREKKIKTKLFLTLLPLSLLYICTTFNLVNITSSMTNVGYINRVNVGIANMPLNIILVTCVSAVYLGVMFLIISFTLMPIKRVQGAVLELAQGHIDDDIRIGNSMELQVIESGLEQISDRFKQNKEMYAKLNDEYSKYLPDQFVRNLGKKSILDLSLGCNIQKEVTSVFIDIRNSTKTSLTLSLADNFAFINRYLGLIGPIVRNHGGFIDKYLGDGVLAVFTNPDVAMRASVKIIDCINKDSEDLGIIGVEVRVGIHTGEVMMGVIGEKKRLNATIISETVNIASHIEKMNRKFGTQILFTKDTLNKLSKYKCNYRYIGTVSVGDGKAESVSLFENIDVYEKHKLSNLLKTKRDFESAVRSYESKGSKAWELLNNCLNIEPSDTVAKLYLKKIKKEGLPPKKVKKTKDSE